MYIIDRMENARFTLVRSA